MGPDEMDLRLLAAVSALVVVTLYAMRLWLELWATHQVFGRIAVITAGNSLRDQQSGCGCGLLLLLLMMAVGIGLLLVPS